MGLWSKDTQLRARSCMSPVKALGVRGTECPPSSPELQLRIRADDVLSPNQMTPGRPKARRGTSPGLSIVNNHEVRAWRPPEGEKIGRNNWRERSPVTCPELSCVQAGSLVKESAFHPVSVARDEEGEVGRGQQIRSWCTPTNTITITWWKELIGRCQVKHFEKIINPRETMTM